MPGQGHPAVLPGSAFLIAAGLGGLGMHGGLARTPTELAGRASTWSDCSGRRLQREAGQCFQAAVGEAKRIAGLYSMIRIGEDRERKHLRCTASR